MERPAMERWRVHKFGGSSVADAACMQRVAEILERDPRPRLAVVLSACRGVTDALLGQIAAAEREGLRASDEIDALRSRHMEIGEALLDSGALRVYGEAIDREILDIQGILQTVRLTHAASAPLRDLVSGFGELWSSRLFARFLADRRSRPGPIRRIEGMLSGTLSYLFTTWDGAQSFSTVVRDAKAKGFTEPDPRDDLSGMDVARKLIILGREMGLPLNLEDVDLEGLVPATVARCGVAEFLDRLTELDEPMPARLESARQNGRVLRYVGTLDAATRRASVGLSEVDPTHPFANINPTDNVVRFITARYDRNPLVVQGPGAGPTVTAGGVFADLLRVCAYLGARL